MVSRHGHVWEGRLQRGPWSVLILRNVFPSRPQSVRGYLGDGPPVGSLATLGDEDLSWATPTTHSRQRARMSSERGPCIRLVMF